MRHKLQNTDELARYIWERKAGYNELPVLKDCDFDFEFNDEAISQLLGKLPAKGVAVDYTNVSFAFQKCVFKDVVKITSPHNYNYEFSDCNFDSAFCLKNAKLKGKWKFRRCDFNETSFHNTTFNDLADFYSCNFKEPVIFYKTDFIGTTVFSASIFNKNALFTYSLIENLLIFRGTKFKDGLDLSLSIGQGEINFFGIELGDFDVVNKLVGHNYTEVEYGDDVSSDGNIPIKNKRETFRILKHTLVSQNNVSESIKYKVLEKSTLRSELALTPDSWQKTFDQLNLWLNWVSNKYGNSYWQAIKFVAVVGLICFYPSALFSDKYSMGIPDCATIEAGIGDFFKFLLPTHSVSYLDGDNLDQAYFPFFIFDFIGRIFVGYGIYQFIQAFRKFR
jgi:hypothetical protein